MIMVKIGIALVSFGIIFSTFVALWDRFTKPIVASKKKKMLFVIITLIISVFSFFIGSETNRLIEHGKDKDEPLIGYIEDAYNYVMCPKYVLYESKSYKANNSRERGPDFQIVLCNTNDLDILINSIDIVIDDYKDEMLDIYRTQVAGMECDTGFFMFYGKALQDTKKAKLEYWGIGDPEGDPTINVFEEATTKYATMEANSHGIVVPYCPFEAGGLYTFHYVVNYSLNGEAKQLILPNETVYIGYDENPNYYFSASHWEEYFGWDINEYASKVDNGMPIDKDKRDKLLTIKDWYENYEGDEEDFFYFSPELLEEILKYDTEFSSYVPKKIEGNYLKISLF